MNSLSSTPSEQEISIDLPVGPLTKFEFRISLIRVVKALGLTSSHGLPAIAAEGNQRSRGHCGLMVLRISN
jgi:hypothetical protein